MFPIKKIRKWILSGIVVIAVVAVPETGEGKNKNGNSNFFG